MHVDVCINTGHSLDPPSTPKHQTENKNMTPGRDTDTFAGNNTAQNRISTRTRPHASARSRQLTERAI